MRGNYPVALSKESSFQKLALLSSFNRDGNSAAFHYDMAYSEVEYKAFRGKNIISYQYIYLKTFDQMEFTFE